MEFPGALSSVSLIPKPPMKALMTVIKKTRMRMVLLRLLAVSCDCSSLISMAPMIMKRTPTIPYNK